MSKTHSSTFFTHPKNGLEKKNGQGGQLTLGLAPLRGANRAKWMKLSWCFCSRMPIGRAGTSGAIMSNRHSWAETSRQFQFFQLSWPLDWGVVLEVNQHKVNLTQSHCESRIPSCPRCSARTNQNIPWFHVRTNPARCTSRSWRAACAAGEAPTATNSTPLLIYSTQPPLRIQDSKFLKSTLGCRSMPL